jgi:hypothetical protein
MKMETTITPPVARWNKAGHLPAEPLVEQAALMGQLG